MSERKVQAAMVSESRVQAAPGDKPIFVKEAATSGAVKECWTSCLADITGSIGAGGASIVVQAASENTKPNALDAVTVFKARVE
jgi:hypothetical protein